MTRDLPLMASSAYATSTIPLNNLFLPQAAPALGWQAQNIFNPIDTQSIEDAYRQQVAKINALSAKQETPMADKIVRRIVQVFIMDPNENVPLDKAMLYQSEQKLTDLTDQELFFEIDIKGILEKHNEYRKTVVDKKVKDRVEYLEPLRVREMKMVVTNVATF